MATAGAAAKVGVMFNPERFAADLDEDDDQGRTPAQPGDVPQLALNVDTVDDGDEMRD